MAQRKCHIIKHKEKLSVRPTPKYLPYLEDIKILYYIMFLVVVFIFKPLYSGIRIYNSVHHTSHV